MGKNPIWIKLNKFLQNHTKFIEECEVIYLLVQIRKILDSRSKKSKNNNSYATLRFYCNWVLHKNLSKPATTKLLTDIFDSFVDLNKTGHKNARNIKSIGKDFFKLSSFRYELKKFLEDFELPTDSLKNWFSHTGKITLEIIRDAPIEIKSVPTKIKKLDIKKYNKEEFGFTFTFINGKHSTDVLKLKRK